MLVHELLLVGSFDVIREVYEQLSETAFGGCIVAEHRRKGCVTERLGQALAKSLASASVIAQAKNVNINKAND